MNPPGTYSWLPACMSAVLETDDGLMPDRIYDALAAIEQRRPYLTAADGIEERAMENAQDGVLTLKAERTGNENAPGRSAAFADQIR